MTRLAKAVFWLAGWASKVRTPRTTYRVVSFDPFVTERSKNRTWLPSQTSVRLLRLSWRIDPQHWDHWALNHSDCTNTTTCPDCRGHICPRDEFDTHQLGREP